MVAAYASARAGLRALLAESGDNDIHVIGDIERADLLARLLPDLRPDVLVLDAAPSAPQNGRGGDERAASVAVVLDALATAEASGFVDTPALIVLGDKPIRADVARLADAALPGWGYLLRAEADAVHLQNAVRAAASGLVILDAAVSLALLGEDAARPQTTSSKDGQTALLPSEMLTPREVDVLEKMAEGLPNKIIATRLGISLHTVKFHVAQILGKLNASSRTEAVTVGARRGFITI